MILTDIFKIYSADESWVQLPETCKLIQNRSERAVEIMVAEELPQDSKLEGIVLEHLDSFDFIPCTSKVYLKAQYHKHLAIAYVLTDCLDTGSGSGTSTATHSPVAVNDGVFNLNAPNTITMTVMDNDTDEDGMAAVRVQSATVASGTGTVTLVDSNTKIKYTPDTCTSGTVLLSYVLVDEDGNTSNTASVELSVTADPNVPVPALVSLATVAFETEENVDINALTNGLNTVFTSNNPKVTVTKIDDNNFTLYSAEETTATITAVSDTVCGNTANFNIPVESSATTYNTYIHVGPDTVQDRTINSNWDILNNFTTHGLPEDTDIRKLIYDRVELNVQNTHQIPTPADEEIRFTTIAPQATGMTVTIAIANFDDWGAEAIVSVESFQNDGTSINRVEAKGPTGLYKEYVDGAETFSETNTSKTFTYDIDYANADDYTVIAVKHDNTEVMPEFVMSNFVVKYS